MTDEKDALSQSWESEHLYHSGDSYYQDLLQTIENARSSVCLEVYIFDLDPVGESFLEALSRAAQRGLRVRLMIDGVGSIHHLAEYAPLIKKEGVELRIYNPVPRLLHFLQLRWTNWRVWLRSYSFVNRRDHRKLCIIDELIAFTGGMNISELHSEILIGKKAWRDTAVRLEGGPVKLLQNAFRKAWERALPFDNLSLFFPLRWPRGTRKDLISPLIRLNDTIRSRRWNYRSLIKRFRQAQRRIWITNAYFVPTGSLLRSLRQAALRGVDVRILLPGRSDIFFMYWVGSSFYGSLLKAGVRIYEYKPRVLHAKSIIVDQWVSVGSTNLNSRSFYHDLELDVVLQSPRSRIEMEKQYSADLRSSLEIKFADWKNRPWWIRLCSRVFLIARYWI